jgi:hypothetical protein
MGRWMLATLAVRCGVVTLALSGVGCSAVVDVDRFHSAQATTQTPDSGLLNEYLDFQFTLIGMRPHVTQLFEYRIIDDATNFVQSRGVVNPLGAADVVIDMPATVPKLNGPFHLDFYADVNGSGGYDGIGSVLTNDHAWRIQPLANYPSDTVVPVDGLVQVVFTHNTTFTDINSFPSGTLNPSHDTMLGTTIHVINADTVVGDLIQVRIVDSGTNHAVGLFRVPQMASAMFDLNIPGVVESANDYFAFVYVDANGNSMYDNPAMPGGDLGWKLSGTANDSGLSVTLDVKNSQPSNVDVGAP